jgi:hypothetical protein
MRTAHRFTARSSAGHAAAAKSPYSISRVRHRCILRILKLILLSGVKGSKQRWRKTLKECRLVHMVMSVLDEVESGLIVLDQDFQTQFINRAFYQMWGLPQHSDGSTYNFADIVEHGRLTGLYVTAPGSIEDYVRQRKGRLRLSDGRILKFRCKELPDGGRLMTFDDISDFVRTAELLRELAGVDELTKLPNRRQFLKSLETEFARVQRYDRPLSVMMIDADDFKQINDRHGHFVGDEVLQALAVRLRAAVRQIDLLGRLGGEEFAVALIETDMPAALEVAECVGR